MLIVEKDNEMIEPGLANFRDDVSVQALGNIDPFDQCPDGPADRLDGEMTVFGFHMGSLNSGPKR